MSKRSRLSRRRLLVRGSVGLVGIGTTITASKAQANPQQPASDGKFKDKIVLITGATSGIGEATAKAFASEGAIVHFCGRREALGMKVQENIIAAGGKASYQKADVRIEEEIKALVDGCVKKYGRIDWLGGDSFNRSHPENCTND